MKKNKWIGIAKVKVIKYDAYVYVGIFKMNRGIAQVDCSPFNALAGFIWVDPIL